MQLPSGKLVNNSTPIYSGSNFTWGEATEKCTRHIQDLIIDNKLIVSAIEIERTIVATAKQLDTIRGQLGSRPIWVNSWYRPQHINKRVGGSKWSRHQYGDAVDIRSNYHLPQAIYKLLNQNHDGGLGKYYSFVHVDWRGVQARWNG